MQHRKAAPECWIKEDQNNNRTAGAAAQHGKRRIREDPIKVTDDKITEAALLRAIGDWVIGAAGELLQLAVPSAAANHD